MKLSADINRVKDARVITIEEAGFVIGFSSSILNEWLCIRHRGSGSVYESFSSCDKDVEKVAFNGERSIFDFSVSDDCGVDISKAFNFDD